MRIKTFLKLALCLTLAGVPAREAQAQSFFQKLFGWGSDASEKPAAASAPKPVPSLGSFSRTSPAGPGHAQWSRQAGSEDGAEDTGGGYRTLCVRTCDGYYFPISGSASSRRFSRDARQCQSMCGSESRLFYMPRGSDDIKNMTDTSGRVYGRLPMAFAYRKSLINGCSCKPMPWSATEAARHDQYALIDTLDKAQQRNAEIARVAEAEATDKKDGTPITSATVAMKLAEAIVPSPAVEPVTDQQTASLETANMPEPPGQDADPLKAAIGHLLPDALQVAVEEDPIVAPVVTLKRPRKAAGGRSDKPGSARPTQTASWFNTQSKYAWPGDAQVRRR